MADPIEVALVRRRRSGKETAVTLLAVAGYLLAVKVAEDVMTGSWQHSPLRLRLLGVRDRFDGLRSGVLDRSEFRSSVERTLDSLDLFDPDHPNPTEEVES